MDNNYGPNDFKINPNPRIDLPKNILMNMINYCYILGPTGINVSHTQHTVFIAYNFIFPFILYLFDWKQNKR